jgi:hypothetical protein
VLFGVFLHMAVDAGLDATINAAKILHEPDRPPASRQLICDERRDG